ncbi:MAG: DUF3418 domain-containing protein, partial [Candidatus Aminicenantes bacterium]|nr:DUF3418 domain-containing protein [Candidatus Aminicenantes bacterium]
HVSCGRIHPEEAHRIFIQSALVEGELNDPPAFLQHNLELLKRLTRIEEKLRRRGYLVGEEVLAEFYSRRLSGIFDERSLRKYIKEKGGDDFLKMKRDDLLQVLPDEKELSGFPDHLEVGNLQLPLTYRLTPGEANDGLTLEVPLTLIEDVSPEALEWGVPGQFREKITSLVRGLPKRYRKLLVPIAEKVEIILDEIEPREESLFKILAEFVRRRFHVDIPASAWAEAKIPHHLWIRVAVIGPAGDELEASRDLMSLKKRKWPAGVSPSSARWTKAKEEWEKEGITSWEFGILPEKISVGPFVTAYPALQPAEGGANIKLFQSKEQAQESHPRGVRSLLFLRFEKDLEFLKKYTVLPEDFQTQALYFGGKEALEKAMMEVLQKEALEKDIRSQEEFRVCAESLTRELFAISHSLGEAVQGVMSAYHKVRMTLRNITKRPGGSQAVKNLINEARQALDDLVPGDFLNRYSLERLRCIPRYLEALRLRVERGIYNPAKDKSKAEQVSHFVRAFKKLQEEAAAGSSSEKKAAVEEFCWMLEEFKVSLFAPELKTAHPISSKRLLLKLKTLQEKT